MTPVYIILGVLLFVAIVVGLWVMGAYNGLVTLRNRFKNSFAQIDVQLKRRYDLIPNLVETAKGYMKHEKETLDAVISARAEAQKCEVNVSADPSDPAAMAALSKAEGNLGGVLGRLMMLTENYPDLKANENMMQLTEELTSTENKVSFARQAYNDSVMSYNTKREMFPTNIIAGMFNFKEAAFFEITEQQERNAPKVQF
ncbi:MAG: LemA family protein [Limisphaerales bacterium]